MKKPVDFDKLVDSLYKKKDKSQTDSLINEIDNLVEMYMGYEAKRDYAELPMNEKGQGEDIAYHAGFGGTDPRIPRNDSDEYNPANHSGLAGPASSGRVSMIPEVGELKSKAELIEFHRQDVMKTINDNRALKVKAFPSRAPNFINIIVDTQSKEELDQIVNNLKQFLESKKSPKGKKLNKYNISMKAPKGTNEEKILVAANTEDPNLAVYVFLNIDSATIRREDLLNLIVVEFKQLLIKEKLISSQNVPDNPQGEKSESSVAPQSTDIKFQQNKELKISRTEFNKKSFNLFINFLLSKKSQMPGFKYLKFNTEPLYDSGSGSPYVRFEKLHYWNPQKQIKVYFKPTRTNEDYEKHFVDKILGLMQGDELSIEEAGNILVKDNPEAGGITIKLKDTFGKDESIIENVIQFRKVVSQSKLTGTAPKSDLVFITKQGSGSKDFWISFKHGSDASTAQQWGGVSAYIGGEDDSKNNIEDESTSINEIIDEVQYQKEKSKKNKRYQANSADVATVEAFANNLKSYLEQIGAVDEKGIPDFSRISKEEAAKDRFKSVIWKRLDLSDKDSPEKRIANKAIFGYEYGSENFGMDNVNALIKGSIEDVQLEKIKSEDKLMFQLNIKSPGFILLNTDNAIDRLVSYNKDYAPMIFARYSGERNDYGINKCRIGIFPIGYRKSTSAASIEESKKPTKIKVKIK